MVNAGVLVSIHLLEAFDIQPPESFAQSIAFFVVVAIACPIGLTLLSLFAASSELKRGKPRPQPLIAIIVSLVVFAGWLLTLSPRG